MKKKLLIGLLIATAPFLIAGCGKKDSKKKEEAAEQEKTIVCTANDDNGELTISLGYDSDKKEVSSAKMRYSINLAPYNEEEQEAFKKSNLCERFTEKDMYKDCKSTSTDTNIILDITLDIDTLLKEVSEDDKKVEADKLAEDLENNMSVKCIVK
jgi:hypothetical protein